jgi:hypothetical protein
VVASFVSCPEWLCALVCCLSGVLYPRLSAHPSPPLPRTNTPLVQVYENVQPAVMRAAATALSLILHGILSFAGTIASITARQPHREQVYEHESRPFVCNARMHAKFRKRGGVARAVHCLMPNGFVHCVGDAFSGQRASKGWGADANPCVKVRVCALLLLCVLPSLCLCISPLLWCVLAPPWFYAAAVSPCAVSTLCPAVFIVLLPCQCSLVVIVFIVCWLCV